MRKEQQTKCLSKRCCAQDNENYIIAIKFRLQLFPPIIFDLFQVQQIQQVRAARFFNVFSAFCIFFFWLMCVVVVLSKNVEHESLHDRRSNNNPTNRHVSCSLWKNDKHTSSSQAATHRSVLRPRDSDRL